MDKEKYKVGSLENLMTLKEVQKVSLDILVDVHNFCVAHDIKYSLAYGTLIGAIRHKGFVPWDDDVDIIMPRPDFEKFCKSYISENGYKCIGPDSPDSYIMYARVYDDDRTYVKKNSAWCSHETGVWIDVFPLDGVPDEMDEFYQLVNNIAGISKKISMHRSLHENFWHVKPFQRKVKWLIKWIITRCSTISLLKNQYKQEIEKIAFESSQYYGQLGCYDGETRFEHNPMLDFENCVEVEFEGYRLLAMNGYDSVLTRYYGNYMELPSEGNRVPKLIGNVEFYWKETK